MICAKCFVLFNSFDDIYATLCGHCFHRDCIVNNCSRCPNCFQTLVGSYNLVKLNVIFQNEAHDKAKMKKVVESKEQSDYLKYQLHKSREDLQKVKTELQESQLQCAELKLDIEAERKMRRFHQLQLSGAVPTPTQTKEREVVKINSDEEPAKKKEKRISSRKIKAKAEPKPKPGKMIRPNCQHCKGGCLTYHCACFKSKLGCGPKCGCTKCDNRRGNEKRREARKNSKKGIGKKPLRGRANSL